MVWRVKDGSIKNHLTVGLKKAVQNHLEVLYTLFEKRDDRWIQIATRAYTERTAYRVYGARLAEAPLSRRIAPVVIRNRAQGLTRFREASYNWLRDSPLRGDK